MTIRKNKIFDSSNSCFDCYVYNLLVWQERGKGHDY